MRRRWKSITALCLSAMIGCVLPAGTMMAAEEPEAAEQLQESETSEPVEEVLQDVEAGEPAEETDQEAETGEPAEETDQEPESEDPTEETDQEAETGEPAEETDQEAEAGDPAEETDQEAETGEPAEETDQEPEPEEQQETDSADAAAELIEIIPQTVETTAQTDVQEKPGETEPVIVIRLQGTDRAQALGGKITYSTYIRNHDQRFNISVEQGSVTALYYYLDTAADDSDESKSEEQLAALWQLVEQGNWQEIILGQDGRYVLYVKAEAADGQSVCARTDGVVIDATAPVITGIDDGGTYPVGTSFGVTDDNLDSVLINEQPAVPSSTAGMYQVATGINATSCVIRAKDKAGNETVCSITVEGEEPDIRYIWVSGSYALKAGRDYHLGGGSWTLDGDSTVYCGGSTFYVKEDGSYQFQKLK